MKILYMSISENYGGAERRLIRVFNGLAKNDNQWRLVLWGKEIDVNSFCKQEMVNDKNVVSFDNPNLVNKYLRNQNAKIIWFFNFDIVICKLLVFKNKKTKYLMTIANYYYSTLDFPSWKRKIAFSFVIKKADIVDCLFPSSIEGLKNKYQINNIHATPVPFTRADLFRPRKKEKTIVFASRLIEEKNIMLLLEAVNTIRHELTDSGYQLKICGTGPMEHDIRSYVANNNLQSVVCLLGRVDTKDILPESSIFITIMRGENYPSQSLIEAISSGNYCIVGRGRDTGKIIKPDFGQEVNLNVEELSESIRKAINMCKESQTEIICAATEFADKEFRYENSLEYFKKLTD